MKTILSSQTVDIPDNGKMDDPEVMCFLTCNLCPSADVLPSSCFCAFSRGEVEGADGDRQGPPWQTRQGVQPHQPGAQPAGQETEEGEQLDCINTLVLQQAHVGRLSYNLD